MGWDFKDWASINWNVVGDDVSIVGTLGDIGGLFGVLKLVRE